MFTEPVILSGFRSILPKYEVEQAKAIRWMASAHAQARFPGGAGAEEARAALTARMSKLIGRFGCDPAKIRTRYSALEDFTHQDWDKMLIFRLNEFPSGLSARERSSFYDETVRGIFREFYSEAAFPPDRLIHVTCTGYVSPSGAQRLISEKSWGADTKITHAYHMGCYAALPATQMAQSYLSNDPSSSRVDLVHTELCSLHMDPSRNEPEQLVIQSLFSDGFIKYSVRRSGPDMTEPGLELLGSHEELISGTEEAMSWMASDFGMRMTLSREVPDFISGVLPGFLGRLAARSGADLDRILSEAVFAIHPGGPKIIDRIAELLGLSPERCECSRKVLRDRGNMSSATLPHIWRDLLDDPEIQPGRQIVSLAFGPGLTVSGALFRKKAAL